MPMRELVFGTLATGELRLKYARQRQRGVQHQSRLSPRAPGPDDEPELTVTVALPQPIERVECLLLAPETAVIPLTWDDTYWDLFNWNYVQVWRGRLPARPEGTLVRYTVQAIPAGGGDPIPAQDAARFAYLVGNQAPPAWTREAIIYQLFPDRFYPGNGRSWSQTGDLRQPMGGTLRGIIDKLDYIADLGCNCLWLNPFFPDDRYHGYHATDYFDVNPRLGTLDDLRKLIQSAHDRGLRVLFDFVANHWGRAHATFQAALADPNSPYVDWYHFRRWPDDYDTFFGVRDLPRVNVDHPGARNYLLKAAHYWVTEFDCDGYRLDFAYGPSHEFWTEFRAVVTAARPDVWIFGEVVEAPTLQLSYEGRFHGCLDFILLQMLRDVFAYGDKGVAALDALLRQHERFFPPNFSQPSFLDNHDMDRFLWLVGGDKRRLKQAAVCQFTLPGPPIIYYGTEVGLSQDRSIQPPDNGGMEEARWPMRWGAEQDADLRAFYRQLIQFRRAHPVLWQGRRETMHLDDDAGTYAYARRGDSETIIVALNVSDQPRTFEVGGQAFGLEPWGVAWRVLPAGSAD